MAGIGSGFQTGGNGGGGGGGLTAEQVRDTIAAFATGTAPITVTHNDSEDELVISMAAGAIPAKASAAEGRAGTDDAKFTTPSVVNAAIEYARTSDIPEASLTGMELVGTGTIDAVNEMKLNTGNFLNIRLSAASYGTLKPLLHQGNTVEFIATDGTVEMTTTMDRAEEFDESAATDDLVINLNSIGSLTLSSNFTNLTLRIRAKWADGFEQAVDDFLSTNLTAANTSIVVTHATGENHGVTISVGTVTLDYINAGAATSGQVLTVSANGAVVAEDASNAEITYATLAQAQDGSAEDVAMSPKRVTDWFTQRNKNLLWESSDGFELATSGSDIGEGKFWFASGVGASKAGKLRGSAANDTSGLRAGLSYKAILWFRNESEWIWAHISVVATESNGSLGNGGSASNKEFSFTVGEHHASSGAASATGNWSLEIYSEVASSRAEETAPRSIPVNTLDADTEANGKLLGVVGGLIGFLDDKYARIQAKGYNNQITLTLNTWMNIPQQSSNPADSDTEITFTPASPNSKFLIIFWSLFENLQGTPDCTIRLQRKVGTNDETVVKTRTNFLWSASGNPTKTWFYFDEPNTTDAVRYRIELQHINGSRLDSTDAIFLVVELAG